MADTYVDLRFVPCVKCQFIGRIGKDSRNENIAWCLLKNTIVNPDVGCGNYKLILPKEVE